MKYSLIIPHFNDPDRLERLLRTVPLGRADIEVIVVDDCSPPSAAFELLQDRWPKVRWLSTERNAGAGAARNVGLRHAKGERLLFADSDDEFLPGAFDTFDCYVKESDELVYFLAEGVQEVDGSPSCRADRMNQLCQSYLHAPSPDNLERLKLGHVCPWAKVYLRAFIDAHGTRHEEIGVGNDVAFNVLAAVQASHCRVVPSSVYRVFRREGSLVAGEDVNTLVMRMRSLSRLNARLAELGVRGRMHAGSYLYRAFWKGPYAFLIILREIITTGLLWPTLRQVSARELIKFARRARQDRRERGRL